ncbi:MAG: metallophosphoesterase [Candidatus Aenigmatarchaeota archaeon]|nr:metallophosphoesterase [Candidatus Aenigmarchaeota archaeon]
MKLKFVLNEPAILINKTLVIGDIHIGYEYELESYGIHIPNQTERIIKKIEKIIKETKAKKLILLGDIKHFFKGISFNEFKDLPNFLDKLSEKIELIIVKGNHDGNIEDLVENIKVYDASGFRDNNIYYFHGNGKPKEDYKKCKIILMSHVHPLIKFSSGNSVMYERCWIISENKNSKLIILPAFNDLLGGVSINSEKIELINGFKFEESKIYLLDGTYIGKIKEIKNKN